MSSDNNKYYFPALNVSNSVATIDDSHINTKIEYSITHVFRSMTVHELNTLHTICELDQKQYTVMYVGPITSQTNDYASPIVCDNNPINIVELDPESHDHDFYFPGPEHID